MPNDPLNNSWKVQFDESELERAAHCFKGYALRPIRASRGPLWSQPAVKVKEPRIIGGGGGGEVVIGWGLSAMQCNVPRSCKVYVVEHAVCLREVNWANVLEIIDISCIVQST